MVSKCRINCREKWNHLSNFTENVRVLKGERFMQFEEKSEYEKSKILEFKALTCQSL